MPSLRHQLAACLAARLSRRFVASGATGGHPIEAARLVMEDLARFLPLPEGVRVETMRSGPGEPGRSGPGGEWLVPESPVGAMLYLHGGGYCLGSIGTHRALCARLARATRCRVLLLDYPLAPEHPFPAALEAGLVAWRWLVGQEAFPSQRLLVGGDSSGGGLALALLMRLGRVGEALPAGALCLSPWLDLTLGLATPRARLISDPMVPIQGAERLARLYAGGADRRDPLLSPLYGDPCGLPPILLQVGTREVLLAEVRRFAASARRVGVPITLEEWDDLMHVWQALAPLVPEASRAIEAIGAWAAAVLDAGSPVERSNGSAPAQEEVAHAG